MANILKAEDTDGRLKISYARKDGAIGYDVVEVSKALAALNTDFTQWIKEQRSKNRTDKISPKLRLTITDIEKGSILIELVGAVVASVVSAVVIEWAKNLVKRLRGISDGDGLRNVNSQYITNCKYLIGGQTIDLSGINVPGSNNTFNYQQITNIYYNLEKASQYRKARPIVKTILPMIKVAMTIVSVDSRPGKDFMALVEKISPEPKPMSMPPGMRMRLLSGPSNPLTADLEVDLEIIIENDEIKRYRLVKIHGELQEPPRRRI